MIRREKPGRKPGPDKLERLARRYLQMSEEEFARDYDRWVLKNAQQLERDKWQYTPERLKTAFEAGRFIANHTYAFAELERHSHSALGLATRAARRRVKRNPSRILAKYPHERVTAIHFSDDPDRMAVRATERYMLRHGERPSLPTHHELTTGMAKFQRDFASALQKGGPDAGRKLLDAPVEKQAEAVRGIVASLDEIGLPVTKRKTERGINKFVEYMIRPGSRGLENRFYDALLSGFFHARIEERLARIGMSAK